MRGIVPNVDESRGAEFAGSADLDTFMWPMSVFASVYFVVNAAGFAMVLVFLHFYRYVICGFLLLVFSRILQSTPASTRAGC